MLKKYAKENNFSDLNSKDIDSSIDFVRKMCQWNHPDVRKLLPDAKKIIASLMSESIRKNYKLSKFDNKIKKMLIHLIKEVI
tara:strand:+ start:539 stop:784 length:246 start_codon:yes stop_codon:yes gene_type:complete